MAPDRPFWGGRREFVAGLLVLIVIAGAGIGMAVRRTASVDPGLTVPVAALDFGTVWEQAALRHSFVLTNATDRPIRVDEIDTGCGCTKVEPQKFIVPAGGRQELTATLDLNGKTGGSDEATFETELRPILAHLPPGERPAWRLHGSVRRNPIVFAEPKVDFADEYVVGDPPPFRSVEVSLSPARGVGELTAGVVAGAGRAEIESVGPRRWSLSVLPAEAASAGPFEFTVRVSGGAAGPFRDLRVLGRVREDVAVRPAAVHLGAIEIGETGREFVALDSRHADPFEVVRVEAPAGTEVTVSGERHGGSEQTLVVRTLATGRGPVTGQTVLHVRKKAGAGGRTEFAVPLEVSYYGIPGRDERP